MVITMALVLETHYNLNSLKSGRKEKNNSEIIISMVILKEPLLMWGGQWLASRAVRNWVVLLDRVLIWES